MCIRDRYKAMIDVEVLGKRAHGGSPEKGINAIAATCQMLTGIREGRLDFESTSNIGVIHGGPKEPGTVCDRVLVRCEARSVQQLSLIHIYPILMSCPEVCVSVLSLRWQSAVNLR